MIKKRHNKKAQVWLSDYTISMFLFVIAALISVKIIINSFSATTDFQELKTEASKISETLFSEGFPVNWTNETVIRPGLLTGKRLDESKVAHAMDDAYLDYTSLKFMLQTKHDFAVIFQRSNNTVINFTDMCVIGNPSISAWDGDSCSKPDFGSIDHKNMVQLKRLVIYDKNIIKAEIYTWN